MSLAYLFPSLGRRVESRARIEILQTIITTDAVYLTVNRYRAMIGSCSERILLRQTRPTIRTSVVYLNIRLG